MECFNRFLLQKISRHFHEIPRFHRKKRMFDTQLVSPQATTITCSCVVGNFLIVRRINHPPTVKHKSEYMTNRTSPGKIASPPYQSNRPLFRNTDLTSSCRLPLHARHLMVNEHSTSLTTFTHMAWYATMRSFVSRLRHCGVCLITYNRFHSVSRFDATERLLR